MPRLHIRQDQQRGSLPVSAFRPGNLATNNLPDCSNMCHESSGCALLNVIGVGKGTVSLEDFEKADAIFVIGQTRAPTILACSPACKDQATGL